MSSISNVNMLEIWPAVLKAEPPGHQGATPGLENKEFLALDSIIWIFNKPKCCQWIITLTQ